jgi:hypothetical protein
VLFLNPPDNFSSLRLNMLLSTLLSVIPKGETQIVITKQNNTPNIYTLLLQVTATSVTRLTRPSSGSNTRVSTGTPPRIFMSPLSIFRRTIRQMLLFDLFYQCPSIPPCSSVGMTDVQYSQSDCCRISEGFIT